MFGALIDISAAVIVTALIMLVPGALLLVATGAGRLLTPLLRPAGAVMGTILMSAIALVITLAAGWSLTAYAGLLGVMSLAAAVVAIVRRTPRSEARVRWRERVRSAVPFAPPALVVAVLALLDSPHVRSDTFWHVALSRKLADLDSLTSATIAFEAGAKGNANYPLPAWHSLVALADYAPRVDLWSATWFLTIWMAPVAMLAFGAMTATFVGERRSSLAGCWGFVAVVVIGYGPWFFASRYLSYAGQIAIYAALPVIICTLVAITTATGRRRCALLALAGVVTAEMGILHGNYVLYPVLFAAGATVLLAMGRREGWRSAAIGFATVGVSGMLALGAQLPWITNDDNFLRGDSDPVGEPTAFIRHRDAFTGTEDSHHVVLGSLATQPMLAIGALAIPIVLLLLWRRRGPWHLAGGALAMVIFARTPVLINLIDKLGSVTPATRFDRVYPAAVGVVAIALGLGWLLERTRERFGSRSAGLGLAGLGLVLVAVAAAWQDSIRDTHRIVVTPFVEARWVGGLTPDHFPKVAVIAASLATFAVAIWIAVRRTDRSLIPTDDGPVVDRRHLFATLVLVAVVVGLAPVTVDRLHANYQPEAYVRAQRNDRTVSRIEVYPPASRAVIDTIPDRAVVLAALNDTRRVASLAPVYSVEESVLRRIVADPPSEADASERLAELVKEWHATYLVASSGDKGFRTMLQAAEQDPQHYEQISAGVLSIYRIHGTP